MQISKQEKQFYQQYYGQLKGFKIESFKMVKGADEYMKPFPCFILSKGKQKIMIEVSQDQEGNGGGFLFITDAIGGNNA